MKLNALLDPRGYQEREVIKLAERVSLDELRKGKILFYNNTKLGFCNYYTVFDRIKEHFTELGITNFVEYTEERMPRSCMNMRRCWRRKSPQRRL